MERKQPTETMHPEGRWSARRRIAIRVGIACSLPLLLAVLYNILIRGPREWEILFFPLMIILALLSGAAGLVGWAAILVGFWVFDKAKGRTLAGLDRRGASKNNELISKNPTENKAKPSWK